MFDNNYINISNIFKALDIQQATLFAHIDSLTWLPAFKDWINCIISGLKILICGLGFAEALRDRPIVEMIESKCDRS